MKYLAKLGLLVATFIFGFYCHIFFSAPEIEYVQQAEPLTLSQHKPEQTKEIYKSALAGNAQAQYDLGQHLLLIDAKPAAYLWLKRAAHQGVVAAQVEMSHYYLKRYSNVSDQENAMHWAELAAMNGSSEGMYLLGQLFLDKAQFSLAADWFKQSAESGNVDAMYQLAQIFRYCECQLMDDAIAAHWFNQAARNGHAPAMMAIATIVAEQSDIDFMMPNEVDELQFLYTTAAKQWHPKAQQALADLLSDTDHDPVMAYVWQSVVQQNSQNTPELSGINMNQLQRILPLTERYIEQYTVPDNGATF
ncbi:tetratricopeptide repeat protein [Motilimonas pumila]|uniref:Sel1 repeat family protein n=1 Tax=Motilimonas pumila TaxID=2303987 RepID=A0A418YFR4_9GAMM|nr:tetratricopeptide repeat protein [Motilimonas pumila]RJG48149.1 sel1 repeat family protein [Motilimonas pumila]